jgi:hypothetical protein
VRVLAGAVAVLSLVACGSARTYSVAAPFVKEALLESTGMPDVGSGRGGEVLRFIPNASFGIGIVLNNTSKHEVVVTDVRVVEPRATLVHQTGTSLLAWKRFTCPPGAFSCPFHGFDLRPLTARPQAVDVGAGEELAVALGFRLGSCPGHTAARAAPKRAVVVFHVPGRRTQRQELPLGTARLRLTAGTSGCRLRG